ncbi:unnamed protein product [Durusdinium trenchii]|uniref:Uncharacterized protein n=1 Tax=Durusdinium trenchii TaxID=1381693 RepID=A0ABP0INJ8_9DINO
MDWEKKTPSEAPEVLAATQPEDEQTKEKDALAAELKEEQERLQEEMKYEKELREKEKEHLREELKQEDRRKPRRQRRQLRRRRAVQLRWPNPLSWQSPRAPGPLVCCPWLPLPPSSAPPSSCDGGGRSGSTRTT